jgi:hypothetical protein
MWESRDNLGEKRILKTAALLPASILYVHQPA